MNFLSIRSLQTSPRTLLLTPPSSECGISALLRPQSAKAQYREIQCQIIPSNTEISCCLIGHFMQNNIPNSKDIIETYIILDLDVTGPLNPKKVIFISNIKYYWYYFIVLCKWRLSRSYTLFVSPGSNKHFHCHPNFFFFFFKYSNLVIWLSILFWWADQIIFSLDSVCMYF